MTRAAEIELPNPINMIAPQHCRQSPATQRSTSTKQHNQQRRCATRKRQRSRNTEESVVSHSAFTHTYHAHLWHKGCHSYSAFSPAWIFLGCKLRRFLGVAHLTDSVIDKQYIYYYPSPLKSSQQQASKQQARPTFFLVCVLPYGGGWVSNRPEPLPPWGRPLWETLCQGILPVVRHFACGSGVDGWVSNTHTHTHTHIWVGGWVP